MSIHRKWFVALTTILLFGLYSAPARAEMDADSFLKQYDAAPPDEKLLYEAAALNIHIGIGWAETTIEELSDNHTRLFCQPGGTTLTGGMVVQTMRQFLTTKPVFREDPYGMVILLADMELWACPKN